ACRLSNVCPCPSGSVDVESSAYPSGVGIVAAVPLPACSFPPRIFFQQSEKECSIRKDGPASVGSELIHGETGRRAYLSTLIFETDGFHPVSSVVLPELAVELVRSTFSYQRNLGAAASAEFRRIRSCLDLNFLDGFGNDSG